MMAPGTTSLYCGQCDDPIEFPTPDDPSMIADVIAAHGATHGEDWRDWGLAVMVKLVEGLEARELQQQIDWNEGLPPWRLE